MVIQTACFSCTEVNFMYADYMIYVFVRESCVKIRVLASIPSLFERMIFGGICSIFRKRVRKNL